MPAGKQDVLYLNYCRSDYHYSDEGDDKYGRRESLRTKDNNKFKWKENSMIRGKPRDRHTNRDKTRG